MKNEENPRDPWIAPGIVKDLLSQQHNKKAKKTIEEATREIVYHRPKKDMMKESEIKDKTLSLTVPIRREEDPKEIKTTELDKDNLFSYKFGACRLKESFQTLAFCA